MLGVSGPDGRGDAVPNLSKIEAVSEPAGELDTSPPFSALETTVTTELRGPEQPGTL